MEIYVNEQEEIFLPVPAEVMALSPIVEVEAIEDGVLLHVFADVTTVPETDPRGPGVSVVLPWHLVNEGRQFWLDWTVAYTENSVEREFRQRYEIDVVSPILPLDEIGRLADWTDEADIRDLERRVRQSVQAFTGQVFGKFRDTREFIGNGQKRLPLGTPLLGVYSANFILGNVGLSSDGKYLEVTMGNSAGLTVMSLDELADGIFFSGAPIAIHPARAVFQPGGVYRVRGLWGYHSIPAPVQQAARLLVVDYSCDESLWRDRFIDSVRAGNWRFEMNEAAFYGTGNVLADQLLRPYRHTQPVML